MKWGGGVTRRFRPIKGTARGTATDAAGKFVIDASSADVLAFSFIGFESQDVAVGNQTEFMISMVASVSELAEVVVIGYGEREKKDLTGSISTLNAEHSTRNQNDPGTCMRERWPEYCFHSSIKSRPP